MRMLVGALGSGSASCGNRTHLLSVEAKAGRCRKRVLAVAHPWPNMFHGLPELTTANFHNAPQGYDNCPHSARQELSDPVNCF